MYDYLKQQLRVLSEQQKQQLFTEINSRQNAYPKTHQTIALHKIVAPLQSIFLIPKYTENFLYSYQPITVNDVELFLKDFK